MPILPIEPPVNTPETIGAIVGFAVVIVLSHFAGFLDGQKHARIDHFTKPGSLERRKHNREDIP